MGSCLNHTGCVERQNILETISRASVSPVANYPDAPDPIPLELAMLDSVNSDGFTEIRRHSVFKRPMLQRSLSSIASSNEFQAFSEAKEEHHFPLRRSYTKDRLSIKTSFLGRAKERLKRQTTLIGEVMPIRDENFSEESTGNKIFSAREPPDDQNYLKKLSGDLDEGDL